MELRRLPADNTFMTQAQVSQ